MSKIEYFILKLNYPVDSETWATDIARTGAQGGCKPLVLCQDCKFRRIKDEIWRCDNRMSGMLIHAGSYCSYGKRREE